MIIRYALLTNENGYTIFLINDYRIRFKSPYSLEYYSSIKSWDNGYLTVMAKYRHNNDLEEEYIDLLPILDDLYIDKETFLKSVKGVKSKND